MKYAITAVTGRFGQVAMKTLADLVPAEQIIGLARNHSKALTGYYSSPHNLVAMCPVRNNI